MEITEVGQGKHYLYRHIRLDNGQVFYVGIGTKKKKATFHTISSEYERAYTKRERNIHWKNIVKSISYRVEILMESDNYKFIQQKEKEFIKLYGRQDLSKGTLVNWTDGGEGAIGCLKSPETIAKIVNANKGRKNTQETKDRIKEGHLKLNLKSDKCYKSIPIYQYSPDGKFVKRWDCAEDVHRELGFISSGIGKSRVEDVVSYGYKWIGEYKGEQILPFYHQVESTKRPVLRLDKITGEILEEYSTLKEAAFKFAKTSNKYHAASNLKKVVIGYRGKSYMGYKWKFKE